MNQNEYKPAGAGRGGASSSSRAPGKQTMVQRRYGGVVQRREAPPEDKAPPAEATGETIGEAPADEAATDADGKPKEKSKGQQLRDAILASATQREKDQTTIA